MKTQSLPPCGLPSVPKYEQAKPQSPGESKGASLMVSESFMSPSVKNGSDVETRTGGQIRDAFFPAFGKLKMLTSEACHKNYVIFDRCEGKSTVILHPSWLNSPPGFSMPEPCFAGEATYFGGGLHTCGRRWIEDKFDFRSSAALSTVGLRSPLCIDATGMQLQQKMTSSGKASCSLIDFVNPGHAQKLEKDIMRSGFLTDVEEESCEEFHENTEEIDALLSSDDELSSTGHLPSDASSNSLCEAKNGHDNKIIGKKRKLGHSTLDEVVDDADSGPYKLAPDLPFRDSKRSGSCVSWHVLSESNNIETFPGVEAGEDSNRGEKSSSAIDVLAEKSECESMKCSGTFRSGPVDSLKRIKIKNNVQQLKSVVPGADSLDTAGVLGQTVQYVKCLQRRLRDLEAAR